MNVGSNQFSSNNRYLKTNRKERDNTSSTMSTKQLRKPLPNSLFSSKLSPQDASKQQTLQAMQWLRGISWSIGGLSLVVFLVMFIQPLLLPIFTFGICFCNGFGEWLEFSSAIVKMSLIPALIALVLGWMGYFAHRKIKELISPLSDKSIEVDQLSPALVARLSSNQNRRYSRT